MAGAPFARADINLPSVPPPQPEPVLTKVYVGESVEIPLVGVSRSGSGLQFIIRRQPASGKLSEIRMTGPNTAAVTYTHNPALGPGVDEFRFAVGAPGIGVSTPARVTVNVVERPAAFIAPARLDFPDIAIGHTARKTLELRNDGGGIIEGSLAVPAPWKIENGDGSYTLGPGESATLEISFTPTEAHQFASIGEFSHAPGLELGLGGRGYTPVEIAPRVIRLESDGRNEVRAGFMILRNVSDEDFDVHIAAPPEVVVQDAAHLAAKSESQIALHTRAGFLGTLDGKLTITGDKATIEVPLQVVAAPARLEVSPQSIDFGKIAAGRAGRDRIVLRNVGGSAAKLNIKMPDGVTLDPDPAYETIAPGASRTFEISYSRPLAGRFSDTVIIEAGDLGLRLPVTAEVQPEWQQAGASAPVRRPGAVGDLVTYNDIPPVDKLGVTRQTKTELDLTWQRTSPRITKYILFLRSIIFDANGDTHFKYERLDRVKVRFVRNEARTTLAGLRPGERITLVIVGLDAAGLATRASQPFVVATKANPVFQIPWLWLGFLALVVLGILIARERSRDRAASDAEFDARVEQMKN